jgi:hypothetical protein
MQRGDPTRVRRVARRRGLIADLPCPPEWGDCGQAQEAANGWSMRCSSAPASCSPTMRQSGEALTSEARQFSSSRASSAWEIKVVLAGKTRIRLGVLSGRGGNLPWLDRILADQYKILERSDRFRAELDRFCMTPHYALRRTPRGRAVLNPMKGRERTACRDFT